MSYITAPGLTNGALFYSFAYDSDSNPDPLLVKFQELANLPKGWRFGEGSPPTPIALTEAKRIYQNVSPVLRLKADAFPGEDGSVTLVFYSGDTCAELFIAPTGEIDLSVEQGEGFDFQEIRDISNASIGDVIRELENLIVDQRADSRVYGQRRQQWNISGSSTPENSIKMSNAFGVPVSRGQVTGAESHWWTFSALFGTPQLQESVST